MPFSVNELLLLLPGPIRVSLEAVRDFLELGGDVLLLIFVLLFVLWGLMLERVLYLYGAHRREVARALRAWEARGERRSWHAHQVRVQLVSAVAQGLERNLKLIQALVTTVQGLCVAIPTVLLHTLVSSPARRLGQILEEQAAGLVAQQAERLHAAPAPEAAA